MMKFLGAQMVRSMCIITLLLFCGLFGAFYVPTLMTGLNNFNAQNPEDVSFFYPADSGGADKGRNLPYCRGFWRNHYGLS